MTDPSNPSKSADPSNPLKGMCTARAAAGRPCRRYAIAGGTVCPSHGGRAPAVKAAAARRLAAGEFEVAYGVRLDTDPASAVLDQLAWANGHVAWLRARIQAIDPDALVWGVATSFEKTSGEHPGVDVTSAARVNTWLQLYGTERDRLVRMCEVAQRMGIEARQIELAERLGGLVGDVMQRVLDDLGLTPEQWAAAGAAIPRRLLELADATSGGNLNGH